MRVSYNGYRVDFQTGILLNKDSWDKLRQQVLPNDSNVTFANDLNDHLSKMPSNMIEVFREFELRKVIPTPTELRKAIRKSGESDESYSALLREWIRRMRTNE